MSDLLISLVEEYSIQTQFTTIHYRKQNMRSLTKNLQLQHL